MKKNILSVIGAATVAAVALKLTTKYVKNEVIKELEDDGYLYDDDDCDDCDEFCGCDERIKKANSGRSGRLYGITLAVVEELTEEYMRKYNSPNTQEIMFRLLVELAKQYETVRLVLNINGKTTEVKYPVKGMMNSDILYGGGFSTCNITPRSEENRIEEFIANNDSQLEDNRRIPIKYIPEVYYGNKLIWKNPNFANT